MAVDALRGKLKTVQLTTKHGIHQTMVSDWKRQAMHVLTAVFSGKTAVQESARAGEAEMGELHAKIGQLLLEREFWPRPPVDKPRTAAPANRAVPSAAINNAPVRVNWCQPIRITPSACLRDG